MPSFDLTIHCTKESQLSYAPKIHHYSLSHYNQFTMGASEPSYSLPPQQVTFDGILFDMDGTIIDSTPAVIKHWYAYVIRLLANG